MKLIDVTRQFKTDDDCLDYLEKMRWPNGVCCIECGSLNVSRITRESKTKNKRTRLYQCLEKECGHQFSPTAGTIFHDSHLSLVKWFMAIAMICEAKKGMSACQIQRHLGINYRTAWHLCHRIRKAMTQDDLLLDGEAVEADETYVGGRSYRPHRHGRHRNVPDFVVLGMIERNGKLKLVPVGDSKTRIIKPFLEKHISENVGTIYTDGHPIYVYALKDKFPGKQATIDHNKTYGMGEVHTNTIENAFSLFKRGLNGSFHKVSRKHLHRYCDEFSFRFNRRKMQQEMFAETTNNLLNGERLPYQNLTAKVSES
ncbi:MAG: IS1595 family transposase [Candidatus Acidiferrales bacterium]